MTQFLSWLSTLLNLAGGHLTARGAAPAEGVAKALQEMEMEAQ
jgi:hypothetical protein